MAAVEYGKCPSIHTSRLARFEYDIRVLEVYFFSPDLNWNVLRTQILASKYGQYGYWNTAQALTRKAGGCIDVECYISLFKYFFNQF